MSAEGLRVKTMVITMVEVVVAMFLPNFVILSFSVASAVIVSVRIVTPSTARLYLYCQPVGRSPAAN